uniref:D-aspartate oxidase-like n=1 Tax=Saccoglossus kowalevskii TaxID=10224 RepID=A0ABM0MKQ6_SACKO|nr:PREDICTED: D-aspartate oxidase-like [Saccoglossus kowalevskii]
MTTQQPRQICVIGAGVIGLSTAVNIIETIPDVEVTVIAERFSPNTTSDVAAGIWLPPDARAEHELGEDVQRIKKWCLDSRRHIQRLHNSEDAAAAGVQLISGFHLFEKPEYSHEAIYDKDLLFGYQMLTGTNRTPFPQFRNGSTFTTYIVECGIYLPWLMARFTSRGGHIIKQKVNSLEELVDRFDLVVTCVGLGAKPLLGDSSMVAVRGQLIKVKAPWCKNFVRVFGSPMEQTCAYIYPGINHVSLGGTNQENYCSEENDQQDIDRIWKNCISVIPALKNTESRYTAGLRPVRKRGVRLEPESFQYGQKSIKVVHNYGHGSYGVIVHWGCAIEATQLVARQLDSLKRSQIKSNL